MIPLAISLVAGLMLCAEPPAEKPSDQTPTPRKRHPFAPSLIETTKEEEAKFDKIIDRFILADTGKLKGPEFKQAMEDFDKLPPESIFALIRGMNKAATINHSCPALTIAKRLHKQLRVSNDVELLTFSRQNIGAGVERSQHADAIKDLRLAVGRRISTVSSAPPTVIRGDGKP
jgi:hypothetical protein